MKGRRLSRSPTWRCQAAEKIETLIGRGEVLLIFEAAPDRLGLAEIVENVDAGDAACFRPRWRFRRSAFDRGSHGHRKTCLTGNYLHFSALADLCKEMSTKSNDNAAAAGRRSAALRGGTLPSDNRFLDERSGWSSPISAAMRWLMQRRTGGAGVILRFERVRPRRAARFQPLKSREITPEFLDRTIRALKRWKFDIVSMDEVCRRAVTLAAPRRFVCLTFDGGYKDLMTSAYPVLSRHGVPFTVYVPTAFPDGVGEAWWLALEADDRAREPHQPGDGSQGAAFRHRRHVREISALRFSRGLDALACRRPICRPRSTISASDIPSISPRCRARPRWTGTISRSLRPIRW